MSEDNLLNSEEYKEFLKTIKTNSDYIDLAENFGPLIFYIKNNDLNSIEKNVKIPENINLKDKVTGNNIFHFIAEYGNEEIFNYMKEKVEININDVNREGETPVFKAVKCGKKDITETLINSGVDINIKDIHGYNLLDTAISNKRKDIGSFLIDKGLESNRENFQNIFEELVSKRNNSSEKKELSSLLDIMVSKSTNTNVLLEKNEEGIAPVDLIKNKNIKNCNKKTKNIIKTARIKKSLKDLKEKENTQNLEKEKVDKEVLYANLKNIDTDFSELEKEQSSVISR